jgi:hypothetical protein
MKIVILCISCLFLASVQAQEIAGISSDSSCLWYLLKGKTYCHDIKSNKTILERDIHADTAIINGLFRKSVSLYQLKGEHLLRETREAINNFRLENITCFQKKIFIGIRFKSSLAGYSTIRYAVLQFNRSLRFENYYIFCLTAKSKFFTLPPFYEMEFIDTATMAMPIVNNGVFDLCRLRLNKQHEIRYVSDIREHLGVKLRIQIDAQPGIVMNPLYYAVSGSGNGLFYEFPFPVFHNTARTAVFDPYNLGPVMDSLKRVNRYMSYFPGLDIKRATGEFGHALLGSVCLHDTLFCIVSNRDPRKVDFITYNTRSGTSVKTTRDMPLHDIWFYFGKDQLFILGMEKDQLSVQASGITAMFSIR